MKPGSVIVDMAAEQGGNCELTEPGQAVVRHGVTIVGYTDLASRLARQSSTLYSTNLLRLTEELCKTKDGVVDVNMEDDAIRGLTVIKDGAITWPPPPPKLPAPRAAGQGRRGSRSPRAKGHGHGARRADVGASRWRSCSASARWLFLLVGLYAPATFLAHFTVFVLACFVGYMVVWNVTPSLHTPLMSVTNAISSIIAIGALVQIAPPLAGAGAGPPDGADPRAGGARARAHGRQHVRRLRGHAAHAGDVPQVRSTTHDRQPGHRLLHRRHHPLHPEPGRARQPGDRAPRQPVRHGRHGASPCWPPCSARASRRRATPWIIGALVVGGAIGLFAAKKVQMTQMPELVALMHSLVGLAACLVGFASYVDTSTAFATEAEKSIHEMRDLHRHPDRRRHLLRLADRVRQAVGKDRRQAAAAARRGTGSTSPACCS